MTTKEEPACWVNYVPANKSVEAAATVASSPDPTHSVPLYMHPEQRKLIEAISHLVARAHNVIDQASRQIEGALEQGDSETALAVLESLNRLVINKNSHKPLYKAVL